MYPAGDVFYNIGRTGARGEKLARAKLFQFPHIAFGDDASTSNQYIVHLFFFHQTENLGEDGHVCAGEYRDANGVHVFLQGGVHHHLRRLAQTGVDDLHTGIAQSGGDDAGAAVVPVEADFGYQYADGSVEGVGHVW